MEFAFTPEQESFRAELRGWLTEHRPPPTALPDTAGRSSEHPGAEAMLAWARTLSRGGWLGLAWPRALGGRGLGLAEQMIFYEEIARYEPPQLGQMVSLGVVGPTLLRYGSNEQKQRLIPRILDVQDIWCLGFSEPGSGSDLASLRTTAIADGDGWRIEGQKIWTSHAPMAQYCFLLARTDPDAKRHHGLGAFALPMDAPGVEIRPIHNLVGEPHFAQLFLNDVRLPRDAIIGEPGQGWTIVNRALEAERDLWVFEMYGELRVALDRALAHARRVRCGEAAGRCTPSHVQALAQAWIDLETLRLGGLRSVSATLRGAGNPLDASRHKIVGSELAQRLSTLAVELLGPHGVLVGRDAHSPDEGLAAYTALVKRSSTLISGTSEVQRNILAQRALGLPRGA